MSDVLKNAVQSIQLGMEDFSSNDPRRPVSALRNFYAGVLLLGKQCLLAAAPEADPMEVIAAKFVPEMKDGKLVHKAKGYQTIDLGELRERFKHFKIEWPPGDIEKLQKLRNQFEHFHSDAAKDVIREAIASCFSLVDGFFAILGRSPKAELGEAWDIMLAETAFFKKLKSECDSTFLEIEWWKEFSSRDTVRCTGCESSLIYQEDPNNNDTSAIKGKCRSCGAKIEAEEVVELFVEAEFGGDAYLIAKEGMEPSIYDCPECGNATYAHSGATRRCFFCDYSVRGKCVRCGERLTVANISYDSTKMCDYCSHMSTKDD